MTYQEIRALEEILEQKCREVDRHVKADKNSNGADNVFAAFEAIDQKSVRTKRDINNPLENQIQEAGKTDDPNRFLVNYYGKKEVWNKAIGDLRLPRISEDDFSKKTSQEQKEYEKQLLKNIVISLALLTNASNRITEVFSESYKLKDRFIAEYLAYAQIYNSKFPDDQMAFGINPDYERGVCVLIGSVPGYSRFSVHFGSPINAANILSEVNSLIMKIGPKIGLRYSQELERVIQSHKKDKNGNESIDNGINYAKNGEFELINSDNPGRKIKTYRLTEVNKAKKEYISFKKTIPKGKPKTEYEESRLEFLSEGIRSEIHAILTSSLEYPLNIYEYNTGMVNCHNGKNVSQYANLVKEMRDEFEIEVAFKIFFAMYNFNKRERMYIAERAGLPLHILKQIDRIPLVQEKEGNLEQQETNNFLKIRTTKMNEEEKIEFIKKVLVVYRHYGEAATMERKNFLENIDCQILGISEERLNDLKLKEILAEYKDALENEECQELLKDEFWASEFITTIAKSTCAEEILEEMEMRDIVEILQTIESDMDLGKFISAFSKKVSKVSKEELKELFIAEEFEMFRFEKILNAVDTNTKKRLILDTIGIVRESLGDDSIIRTTIEEMDTNTPTINRTLKMYDQIKNILNQTTSDSRQEALDIEAMLENIEIIDEIE